MPLLGIAALVVPALLGIVGGAVLGHRQVRALREATGDQSQLTNVLSGEFLRSREDHRKAA